MGDWKNLLLLFIEAGLYFAVMAALFRVRHRFGIGLVFCALGAMHFLETYLAAILYLDLPGGIVVSPGSIVLFSGKLVMLLLVYIREDAAAVRQPIYGLLIGNFLMVALVFTMRFHEVAVPVPNRAPDFRFMDEMGGLMIWGTILLFIDAILIILLYERSAAWFGERQAPRIIATAALVLTFDQLGFFTALWLLVGVPLGVLFSGWIAKMGAALVYGLMAAFYLRHVETAAADRGRPRLADVFDTLTYRRRTEPAEEGSGRDAITGLLDRSCLGREGPGMVAAALAGGRPLSLILIDIDRFADFNRKHGEAAGEEMLRRIGAALREGSREPDRIYRHGGEEFVLLSDGLDHRPAQLDAERLRRRIAAITVAGGRLTVSVGVATAPGDGADFAALLEAAERRLGEARAAGRDRVAGRHTESPDNVTPFTRRESA
jgi:diguanylate cyclase (GGDEF)-like protein